VPKLDHTDSHAFNDCVAQNKQDESVEMTHATRYLVQPDPAHTWLYCAAGSSCGGCAAHVFFCSCATLNCHPRSRARLRQRVAPDPRCRHGIVPIDRSAARITGGPRGRQLMSLCCQGCTNSLTDTGAALAKHNCTCATPRLSADRKQTMSEAAMVPFGVSHTRDT
jgi:hypothetical protein